MEPSNRLADQIKKLRLLNGLTQEQLADSLNIKTKQRISDYERGRTQPEVLDLIKMSDFFKVSLDYLIKGEEENKQIDYTPIVPDKQNEDYEKIKQQRDELKDKLLIQHERYQQLLEKYNKLEEEIKKKKQA